MRPVSPTTPSDLDCPDPVADLPQFPSPTPAIRSIFYSRDDIAVFKVGDHLFRINRATLDKETDMIPHGQDPIELTNIKPGDFEIMLDFLNLGTRHDNEPFTKVDLASVITVSSIYGMQCVLNLACKTLSDQQNRLDTSRAGAGFDTQTCGLYFLIREKGTVNCLANCGASDTEGVQLQLWPLPNIKAHTQIFFIDSYGALCHAVTGHVVDIIDDVPVLRQRRPVSGLPNPWSRPPAEFSFINSQIRVKFPSNPALPGSTDDLYPGDFWATKQFILAAHTEKDFHMHPISDFAPWIPPAIAGSFEYTTNANHDKKWRVLAEERMEDVGGERTSWEIVRASMS